MSINNSTVMSFNTDNENEFSLYGNLYYRTKKGKTKVKEGNNKSKSISEIEYMNILSEWKDIFGK